MSDAQIDKMVLRVRRLLAVANDNRGNENEAANAAALAQRLVAEYGLELAQIEASQGREAAEAQGGTREKKQHDRAAMYRYQRDLMGALAVNNFCRHFIDEANAHSFGKMRKVKRHVLIGRTINVQATLLMYDYLIETMDRLLPWQGMEKRGKKALAWLDGCATRLTERLAEKRREQEAETRRARDEDAVRNRHPGAAPGTALVLSDVTQSEDAYNNDVINGWPLGTTAARRAECDARDAAQRAEREALIATIRVEHPNLSEDVFQYLRWGYTLNDAIERAERTAVAKLTKKDETDAQRAKREAKEKAQSERYWDKWQKREDKENARKLNPAFRAGAEAGDGIGLDKQVGVTERMKIG